MPRAPAPASGLAARPPGRPAARPPGRIRLASSPPAQFFEACTREPNISFSLIFTAMVFGDPNLDVEQTAADLVNILAHDGLLCVLDHMPDAEPPGRWWRFRPADYYITVFGRLGVTLRRIGTTMQIDNEVTVLAGHRS